MSVTLQTKYCTPGISGPAIYETKRHKSRSGCMLSGPDVLFSVNNLCAICNSV